MDKLISTTASFALMASPSIADDVYYMSIDVPPYEQQQSQYYLEGIEALQNLCDETEDENVISVCREGSDIADEILGTYVCIDPDNIPSTPNECQADGVKNYIASLQYVFQQHFLKQGHECKGDEKQELFIIEGRAFVFDCLPA